MPTALRRFGRTFEARATVLFVAALIVLSMLGFARVYTITNTLKQQNRALNAETRVLNAQNKVTCQLRQAGRANTNLHERVPLKAALNYLGSIGLSGAKKQTDPVKKKAALDFAEKFLAFAKSVQPLPNPEC